MSHPTLSFAGLAALSTLALAGCDKPPAEAPEPPAEESAALDVVDEPAEAPATATAPDTVATAEGAADPATPEADVPAAALPEDTLGDDDTLEALVDDAEIPYPVYPNGAKYRVGGENGMKIVLFETEDSFDEVDAYYSRLSDEAGMPRLMAMSDYVRYAKDGDDEDPWATHRPGIVIHQFEKGEREAVGADQEARTNIIMSF